LEYQNSKKSRTAFVLIFWQSIAVNFSLISDSRLFLGFKLSLNEDKGATAWLYTKLLKIDFLKLPEKSTK
jgi:hypothetical protein